jgi:hypothetical protein
MATIRNKKAIRAEVRFRLIHETIAGEKLIRCRMESQPRENSSISFGHPLQRERSRLYIPKK